jgi:hypothetical protein
MVARVLAALPSRPRLLAWPDAIARPLLKLGSRLAGATPAIVDRMYEDLVFDAADARRDFGYSPRAFAPDAATLGS